MGFVQISDDLEKWKWFKDKNTVYVYLFLLLRAKWGDTYCDGVLLKRGQTMITLRELSTQCRVTMQEIRTILDRLTATHKITKSSTPKFSIITLLEYDCATQTSTQNAHAIQQSVNKPSLLYTNNQTFKHPDNAGGVVESDELNQSFSRFWEAYPKKTAKQQALTAWKKLKPDTELTESILKSLERQKKSAQWTKDGGQYIPYPATWLNGKRWEDELTEVKTHGTDEVFNRTADDWLKGFRARQ